MSLRTAVLLDVLFNLLAVRALLDYLVLQMLSVFDDVLEVVRIEGVAFTVVGVQVFERVYLLECEGMSSFHGLLSWHSDSASLPTPC